MNGGLSQAARVYASLDADHDRFHAALDASEAFMDDCDRARAAHRADCLARYGEDIFGEDGK